MSGPLSRRGFLIHTVGSATWVAAHWSDALAAAAYARHVVCLTASPQFEFFSSEQAAEIDAITARIIPSDSTPGAREAGVVYFIDRALKTFARTNQKVYLEGLLELEERVRAMFPGIAKFSAATPTQQDLVLNSIDRHIEAPQRPFRSGAGRPDFFETVRRHTLAGFLIDPDSDLAGNRDGVGWKVINREREHMFQPPFGYYDKDYPGWQPVPDDLGKK